MKKKEIKEPSLSKFLGPKFNNIRLLLIFLGIILSACNSERQESTTPISFYYWKTRFKLRPAEKATLKATRSTKVYLRFFDIKLAGNEIVPVSAVKIEEKPELEAIPVVYLENRIFSAIVSDSIPSLAQKLLQKVRSINTDYGLEPFKELQLDCDWSVGTQKKYFQLLQEIKKRLPPQLTLSCTIKLWQYKNPKIAGIPPVNKGVLMYYNFLTPLLYTRYNTILENSIGQTYLNVTAPYALPLDLALPIYSIAAVFDNPPQKCKRLSVELAQALKHPPRSHFSLIERQTFLCTRDTLISGILISKNSICKIEKVSLHELKKAIHLLYKAQKQKRFENIIFYDLAVENLENYPQQFWKNLIKE